MYGNTEELAEIIATQAAQGVKDIVMHNVTKSDQSEILRDVFKYKGLIIGSPTYNSKLYPAVESLISALENRFIKNRFFDILAVFLGRYHGKAPFHLCGEHAVRGGRRSGNYETRDAGQRGGTSLQPGPSDGSKLTSGAEVKPPAKEKQLFNLEI